MADLVIDSSVLAKWVLPEPDSALALQLLAELGQRGDRPIFLDLALVEVANAIWKVHHRGNYSAIEAENFVDQLLRLPAHIEPAQRHLSAALSLAMRYSRAMYDALFVVLALELGIGCVTADEPLFRATHSAVTGMILLRDWKPASP